MKKNNKGIAVFTTLMFLFLLSLVAVGVLLTAYNYNNICEGQLRRIKAMTSAEAGINYAYYHLRVALASFTTDHYSEATADTVTPGTNGMTVKVWAEGPVSGRYTISSKVIYQKTEVP